MSNEKVEGRYIAIKGYQDGIPKVGKKVSAVAEYVQWVNLF